MFQKVEPRFQRVEPPGGRGMPKRGWGTAHWRPEAPQNGLREGRSQDELEHPAMPARAMPVRGGQASQRGPARGAGEPPPAVSAPGAGAGLRSPRGGSGQQA
ncbi:hypothetical protein LBMAG41_12340 [Cyanobium sp.]|nr:hypothetical protein LBMAG41_12340 [Cyanobium sp.]